MAFESQFGVCSIIVGNLGSLVVYGHSVKMELSYGFLAGTRYFICDMHVFLSAFNHVFRYSMGWTFMVDRMVVSASDHSRDSRDEHILANQSIFGRSYLDLGLERRIG
jgi:hypothetical protein